MSLSAVVCGGLTAAAVRLLLGFRQRLPPSAAERTCATDGRIPRRVALSLLAGVVGALVVSGPPGAVVAVVAALLAWRRLGRLVPAAETRRRRRLAAELSVAVDLLAGALRSGADPGTALRVVADAMPGPVADELAAVLHRLGLGADPGAVWHDLGRHPQLAHLGRALARAHRSGSSVVVAAERLAVELREQQRAEVESRARSVSTRAAAPLGLCFLPAFVLLGIVPLVAGLIGGVR